MKKKIARCILGISLFTVSAAAFATGGCGSYLECLFNPNAAYCNCHISK